MRWSLRFLVIAIVAGASFLGAQQPLPAAFRGVVTANKGQAVVDGAEITFDEAKRSVRSGADGRFLIDGLAAARYHVTVRRIGFGPISGIVTLVPGDTVTWRFDMVVEQVQLSTVDITTEDGRVQLREFVRRREMTNGRFLTDREIAATGGQNLGNIILSKVPGFQVVQHPTGMGTVLVAGRNARPDGSGRNGCYTAIWVNGDLYYSSEKSAMPTPPSLEDFNLADIAAAEFYRASEVPPELQFRSGSCGVAVLWMQVRRRRPHD
jgi:hypothetical protein